MNDRWHIMLVFLQHCSSNTLIYTYFYAVHHHFLCHQQRLVGQRDHWFPSHLYLHELLQPLLQSCIQQNQIWKSNEHCQLYQIFSIQTTFSVSIWTSLNILLQLWTIVRLTNLIIYKPKLGKKMNASNSIQDFQMKHWFLIEFQGFLL